MPKRTAARSFLERIADYDDPTPHDLDPEDNLPDLSPSESEEDGVNDKRSHYVALDDSKIRHGTEPNLGPRYEGSSVSRTLFQNVEEDDLSEEEDPFAEKSVPPSLMSQSEDADPDDNGQSNITSNVRSGAEHKEGNRQKKAEGDQLSPFESDLSSETEHSETDKTSSRSSSPTSVRDDRAALRKLIAEEQKTVVSSLSITAQADIEKGRAIRKQSQAFDSLLNVRIKLQKALIAANSLATMPATEQSDITTPEVSSEAFDRAEIAAARLWSSLTQLRDKLDLSTDQFSESRKHKLPDRSDYSSQWKYTLDQDAVSLPKRRAVLTKWSQRTNPINTARPKNRLSSTPSQLPLTTVLDQQLSGENLERTLQKSRIPRSFVPLQGTSAIKVNPSLKIQETSAIKSSMPIYDDADFYTLLLRDLVNRRMTDAAQKQPRGVMVNGIPSTNNNSNIAAAALLQSTKSLNIKPFKAPVDTKASKGRKMRYNVHEKLQNFMVPEDRGTWGQRQRDELFRSLLGRKVELGGYHRMDEGTELDEEEDGYEDYNGMAAKGAAVDVNRTRGAGLDDPEDDEDEIMGGQEGGGLRLFG